MTRKEYGILEHLVLHENQVIRSEEITEHVWNNEFDPFFNAFHYHIHSLNQKLSLSTIQDFIKTVRGQDYMMEDVT